MAVSQKTKVDLGLDDDSVLNVKSDKFGGGVKGFIAPQQTATMGTSTIGGGVQQNVGMFGGQLAENRNVGGGNMIGSLLTDPAILAAMAGAKEVNTPQQPSPFIDIPSLLAGVGPGGSQQSDALAGFNPLQTLAQGRPGTLPSGGLAALGPPGGFADPRGAQGTGSDMASQLAKIFSDAGLSIDPAFAQMLATILPLLGGFGGQQAGGQ